MCKLIVQGWTRFDDFIQIFPILKSSKYFVHRSVMPHSICDICRVRNYNFLANNFQKMTLCWSPLMPDWLQHMSIWAPALAEHWVIGTSHQFIRRIELWTWTWTTAPGDPALPVQFDLIAFITCHADSILHNHHILNFWSMVKCHPSSILNVNLYLIHDTFTDMMLFSRIYCRLNSEKVLEAF